MSLRDAVAAVAEGMEELVNSLSEVTPLRGELKAFAMSLRIAMKAAGPDPPPAPLPPKSFGLGDHRVLIEQEKAKMRAERAAKGEAPTLIEEEEATKAVEVCGGGADASLHNVPEKMPVGGLTEINGEVYQLGEDLRLHIHFVETDRLQRKRKKAQREQLAAEGGGG